MECRNPSLCTVCSFWFHQPAEVVDVMDEYEPTYDEVMERFEAELVRKWHEKVEAGVRQPQAPSDGSLMSTFEHQVIRPDATAP